MSEIQKGDVKILKSGGPEMTVFSKDSLDWWICGWFEEHKLITASFPAEALADPKKGKSFFEAA